MGRFAITLNLKLLVENLRLVIVPARDFIARTNRNDTFPLPFVYKNVIFLRIRFGGAAKIFLCQRKYILQCWCSIHCQTRIMNTVMYIYTCISILYSVCINAQLHENDLFRHLLQMLLSEGGFRLKWKCVCGNLLKRFICPHSQTYTHACTHTQTTNICVCKCIFLKQKRNTQTYTYIYTQTNVCIVVNVECNKN